MELLIVLLAATGIYGSQLQFLNNLPVSILVRTAGNFGTANLNGEGTTLTAGQQVSISAPASWSGKIWAETGSTSATTAYLSFKEYGELDSYNVTVNNGVNVGIKMQPINGQGDGSAYSCKTASCGTTVICSDGTNGLICIPACGTNFTCTSGTYSITFGG